LRLLEEILLNTKKDLKKKETALSTLNQRGEKYLNREKSIPKMGHNSLKVAKSFSCLIFFSKVGNCISG